MIQQYQEQKAKEAKDFVDEEIKKIQDEKQEAFKAYISEFKNKREKLLQTILYTNIVI